MVAEFADGHDGEVRPPDNGICHGPQPEPGEALTALGVHHDQVRPPGLGCVQDGLPGQADGDLDLLSLNRELLKPVVGLTISLSDQGAGFQDVQGAGGVRALQGGDVQ